MARTVEDVAASCRRNVRATLRLTGQLLRDEPTPATSLLARMNDALGAVVESNFGAATHGQLRRLHAAIGERQPAMIDNCDNLALLYFARSLAVVLEEAVRQKQAAESRERQRTQEQRCMRQDYGSYRREEKAAAEDNGEEKVEQSEKNGRSSSGVEEVVVEQRKAEDVRDEQPLTPPYSPLLHQCRAADDETRVDLPAGVDDEPWGGEEGAAVLTINGISPHIGAEQLTAFLEVMGHVAELHHYPRCEGWHTGAIVCRFENAESARKAIARLNHKFIRQLPRTARDASAPDADTAASPPPTPASPTDTNTVTYAEEGDTVGFWDDDEVD